MLDPRLRALAEAYGIATSYRGNDGKQHEASRRALIGALAGFDVRADSAHAVANALEDRAELAQRRLPQCVIARHGETSEVAVRASPASLPRLRVLLEDGGTVAVAPAEAPTQGAGRPDGTAADGTVSFRLPDSLPCGYHRLELAGASEYDVVEAPLIVVPRYLGLPEQLGPRRVWGFAVQLYSIRSEQSWGIGDFADLAELADWAAAEGAGYLLTNPLHAAEPTPPITPSPYSPVSRRFLNPIYLRPEAVPEYAELANAERARIDQAQADLTARLADVDTIDRDAVWIAKIVALQAIHDHGLSAERRAELESFCAAAEPELTTYATWCALVAVHPEGPGSRPQVLADPGSAEVAAFRAQHHELIDFYRWLQWVADEQLAAAQLRARQAGMPIGIVNDLAVGVDTRSAEVWGEADAYARRISIGAPPDAYNSLGQGWGLAAWRPDRLAATAYRPFRELARAALRSCGGLRVDHIMGLFRLWWIPDGCGPVDGVYVRYDHDALVGVLMLEAQRAGALVVGEDLGTVEPWVRDYLAARGLLGTSVLWFERSASGAPLPAERYREYSMASVTTHDLAPTAGYLAGEHLTVRDRLGLLGRPLAAERAEHEADLARWRAVLAGRGLLPDPAAQDELESEILALHRYLGASPARVLCAALSDAVGDRRMQNQPGTTDEYPNWRVPLTDSSGRPVTVQDLRRSARAHRLAAVLNEVSGTR